MDRRAAPTRITFSTVFNFRDLGGHPGQDGRTIHYGRLYRSDSLHRLTGPECLRLAELGIRTVLDLRRPYEIERDGRIRTVDGIGYHNIHPVHREWDPALYDESAGPARYLADRYLDMAEEGVAGLGAALRLIADPQRTPLVMHCFAGKDRTGVLAALALSLLGVADTDIAADYARSAAAQASLAAQIRRDSPASAASPPPVFLACPPEAMLWFLADLRARYGSIPAYVATGGVTGGHIAALRAHLLD